MLHTPAVRAREHARLGRHGEYRDAVETLFGLDVPGSAEARAAEDRRTPRHRAD